MLGNINTPKITKRGYSLINLHTFIPIISLLFMLYSLPLYIHTNNYICNCIVYMYLCLPSKHEI